jgi:hypothetical protein
MTNKKKRRKRLLQRQKQNQLELDIQAEHIRNDVVFAAAEVTIEASDDGTPAVSITAYTGGLLSLPNFQHPAVINLDGVKAMDGEQLPFLRDHQQSKVVGHGKPQITKASLHQQGKLSIAGEERDKIVAGYREGFRWQASVGGRIPNVRKHVQTVPAGKRARVNGRSFDGPVQVVNAFLWKETSFVAVGADEGRASASIAAANNVEEIQMGPFEKWLEAKGWKLDDLSAEQKASLKAAYDAEITAANESNDDSGVNAGDAGEVDVEKITEAAVKAAMAAAQQQSQRDRRIDRLFASYTDSMPKEETDKLRASVESGEISEEKAHLDLLLASRGRGGTFSVHSGGGGIGEHYALELEAGVNRTAGLGDEEIKATLVSAGASDDQADAAVERSQQNPKGLKSIILAVCRQEGHVTDEVDDDAIRCAMAAGQRDVERYGRNIQASSGGFSSVSVPGILSRLANKAMLAAYAEADDGGVATTIASTTSTRDFKKFTRYRMTESGVMVIVPPSGEIKHGEMLEEQYENQVQTYGKMISLSRQMMRNDDLDAFLQIPRMIGRMGRHALEQNVITTLVDAPTNAAAGTTEFFHGAIRGNQEPNYLAGAATNLSFDALEPAYELFLNQVDADGKPIMVDPALLLCTNGDIVAARKLFHADQVGIPASPRRYAVRGTVVSVVESDN